MGNKAKKRSGRVRKSEAKKRKKSENLRTPKISTSPPKGVGN